MSLPNCPECGDPLMETVSDDGESGYSCINAMCDETTFSPDEVPAVTGSPLDVAETFGEVRLDTPDPRRGMDTVSVRFDPDEARRLAEALEQAASDAERQSGGR